MVELQRKESLSFPSQLFEIIRKSSLVKASNIMYCETACSQNLHNLQTKHKQTTAIIPTTIDI